MDNHQRIFALASILLQYPERDWAEESELVEEIGKIDHPINRLLFKQFLKHTSSMSYLELCSEYVQTFDFNEKATLYLTHSLFGDNPDRGRALIKLKNEYLEAGFPLDSDELPDYLPLILEFCSLAEEKEVHKMLSIHKRAIDQLLKELSIINSPYQMVLQACVHEIESILRKQKAS